MALNEKKITSYTDNVKTLSDYPSDDGITAAQLKAIFDGRTDKEVKSAINGIIDELTATTGAAQLGTADGGSVQTALDSKVSAQAGKGLSTNDYTTAEKQKLSGIAAGATKTIVDAALSASSENPVQNKSVKAALDTKANKAAPIIQNKLYVQTGTTDGATPAAPHMSVFPVSGGACIRYGEGNAMTPTLKITENGLLFNQDGDDYKVYAENNKPPADAALSATSTNPVQNKAVKAALDAKANAANPQFSGTATINTSGAGELRVRNNAGNRNFVELSVTPGDEDAALELKLKRGNTAETFDTGKIYTSYDPQPADSALSATSTNPVQNKAVKAALAEKADINTPWFSGDAVFSGGVNTTFNPKYKVLLSDNTATLQFSSDISPIPDGLVFGDGSLKFLTAGKEYAVYTEGNPPPVERYNGASPIDPATVRDIFRCAMTYTNNKDSFAFTSSGNGTLFDADFSASSPKIDCSSLMMAWIMGIPYEYSKYAGKDNIKHYGYGIDLPANPYVSDRPNRYYTHELAHYFNDQGWCFKPNEDYSNIAPGDIIFVSFASGDGQSEFHDSAYMKIDHCLLVLGYKDATHLTCLHTSALYTLNFFDVPILPSNYDSTSTSNYNNAIKLVARLPFRRSCGIVQTPVVTDATEKTTTSTTNGLLATLTLSAPLKKNTPYTLIAHLENAATQTAPSSSNYFGVRASYSSGASDATIYSWQRNVNPKDNLYRCYFVVEDDPITQLKLYVLSTSVAGHHYKFCGLFEGLVAPTPNSDGTFN